tara:strand:- start:6190 stop:8973 length:2784 start_codon:yes stop_codon:yes gene_type:complete
MPTFLQKILPDEGYYCIVGLRDGESPKQSFYDVWEDVDTEIENLLKDNFNVYFACASFTESEKRTQENALYMKSFWLDLDCGEGKPYPNQADALEALLSFCQRTKLPAPTIINSGRGVHIYWILTEAIDRDSWNPVARQLKILCKEKGLEADPAVTADSARILRVPDTLNHKTDPPSKVSILHESPEITFAEISSLIGTTEVTNGNTFAETDPRKKNNQQFSFAKIVQKIVKGKGCTQIEYALKHQDKVDYNLWRAILSIAANCKDSDVAIHAVSDKHPDYDRQKTEEKAVDLIDKAYRCDTIDETNINICDDCPHFGRIRSPIELGLEVKEQEEDDNLILDFMPPKLPYPFFRAQEGGIYKKARDPDDEDLLVYHNDIFLVKRLYDKEKGDMALAKLFLPKDGIREFLIPLASMTSKEELRKILSAQGVVMMPKQLDNMMVYLIECTKSQQSQDEAEIMRTQFGWVDNDSKFILGDKEINCSAVRYSPPSPKTESICKWLVAKGDIEEWKNVIQVYNKPNFEPHAFGFFTAFGAPLIKHLGFNGALINLINSSSGTGKSTVLKMCNSVYGHPDKLLAQETDTFAHKMYRLGVMNNLPYTVDEITNMHPESVSTLLYNVSQGSGPGRMQSQNNIERKNDTNWSLIALASSNASMAEKLSLIKQFADGEIMRLLEYRIDRTDNISKSDAYKLFEGGLLNNYGLAGPIYIEYLVKNLAKAVDLARGIQEHLDAKASLNSRERFWSAVISCNIAGAQIASHLKLINLDIPRVLNWASNELVDILREQIIEPEIDFVGVLGGFLNANRGHILVVNGAQDARNSITPLPIVEPRYELTTRLEPDTEILYVFSKAIRNYCAKEQIIFKDLVRDLKEKGIHQGTVRKRLAKGTSINSPPVEAHIFKLDGTDLIDTEFMQTLGQEIDDPDSRDSV